MKKIYYIRTTKEIEKDVREEAKKTISDMLYDGDRDRYENEEKAALVAETAEAGSVAYETVKKDQWDDVMEQTKGKISDFIPE